MGGQYPVGAEGQDGWQYLMVWEVTGELQKAVGLMIVSKEILAVKSLVCELIRSEPD